MGKLEFDQAVAFENGNLWIYSSFRERMVLLGHLKCDGKSILESVTNNIDKDDDDRNHWVREAVGYVGDDGVYRLRDEVVASLVSVLSDVVRSSAGEPISEAIRNPMAEFISTKAITESGISIRWSGHAPVQAEGTVDGMPMYFRSRYEYWSFAVAGCESVDPVMMDDDANGFYCDGKYDEYGPFSASWMKDDQVERIIRGCIAKYRMHQGCDILTPYTPRTFLPPARSTQPGGSFYLLCRRAITVFARAVFCAARSSSRAAASFDAIVPSFSAARVSRSFFVRSAIRLSIPRVCFSNAASAFIFSLGLAAFFREFAAMSAMSRMR